MPSTDDQIQVQACLGGIPIFDYDGKPLLTIVTEFDVETTVDGPKYGIPLDQRRKTIKSLLQAGF